MKTSYYDRENLGTRLFAYYGNTGDLFVDETLYPQTICQALHRELRVHGYERIVFYNYKDGAYFLDEGSKKLWYGRTEEKPKTDLFGSKRLIKGSLRPKPKTDDKKEKLSFTVAPAEMMRTAEHFVNDKEIATAVIFPNGIETLKEFAGVENGKILDDFFVRITESSIERVMNPNVVIFLFNRSRSQVETILSGKEKESLHKYLMDVSLTTSHTIPLPGKKEIRNTLNYLRIHGTNGRKLNVACKDLDVISDLIARKIARNVSEMDAGDLYGGDELKTYNLERTIRYLMIHFSGEGALLNEAACRRICRRKDEKTALEKLNDLTGMKPVKDTVNGFLNLNRNQGQADRYAPPDRLSRPAGRPKNQRTNLHFVLTGSKGTGKTTAARLLGEILCEYGFLTTGHTIVTSPARLVGSVRGASEQNIRQAVEDAIGGVLFIDEAYELAGEPEIVTQIVADMDRFKGEFSLVMAGYPDRMEELMETNEGLKGRFGDNWIRIEDYKPEELEQIFKKMAADKGFAVSEELESILPDFFENWYYAKRTTEWANAREAENLLGAMMKYCPDGVLTPDQIPETLKIYTTDQAQEDAMDQLEHMVGLSGVKKEIRKMIRQSRFEGTAPPKHFIFAGNPGTGKTTVARILGLVLKKAGVLKRGHVVTTDPSQLIAGYKGQSAIKAREVFDTAVDGVLFIDEAYGLLPSNALGKETDFGGAVMDMLLKYTDPSNGQPICFVCAGYERDMKAFLDYNPGLSRRFHVIRFDNYSVDELMEILGRVLEAAGYEAEPGYMEAARANFSANIRQIQEKYNGGYVSGYFASSKDRLFERLEETYGDGEVPKKELKRLLRRDAP